MKEIVIKAVLGVVTYVALVMLAMRYWLGPRLRANFPDSIDEERDDER